MGFIPVTVQVIDPVTPGKPGTLPGFFMDATIDSGLPNIPELVVFLQPVSFMMASRQTDFHQKLACVSNHC